MTHLSWMWMNPVGQPPAVMIVRTRKPWLLSMFISETTTEVGELTFSTYATWPDGCALSYVYQATLPTAGMPLTGIPAFLVGRIEETFQIAFVAGSSCPADPAGLVHYRWDVPPGGTQIAAEMPAPGTYCLAVWAVDAYGRPGGATAVVVRA